MNNEDYKYNPADANSIEQYAMKLLNKTFLQVIDESGITSKELAENYANKFRKGGLGNLLEEVYFGYKANSRQEADFSEAGVELKVSPFEIGQKGHIRAGERLVLTMIKYDGPIETDFKKSHAWEKMKLILLVYYLRNKEISNRLLYPIKHIKMFTPPEEDLEIIKKDYQFIVSKIMAGKAHELSESDTMYLGACTKGANAVKSTVPQYYGDKTPARKRAFCFKTSYMTYVLNNYITNNDANKNFDNSILKDVSIIKEKSFEEILDEIVSQYIGMTDKELCEKFNREYNNNKAQWNDLAFKMLDVRDEHADELEKANIKVKTIRLEENNKMVENMSFPPFKFMDIVNEDYESSELHTYFEETRLFFFIWKKEGNFYKVQGCQLWNMPHDDLEITVKKEWEDYKHIFQYGVEFEKYYNRNGKISIKNNLPNKKDTKVIHVRPHAQKAAYKLHDGYESGNITRDANVLPNGDYMTTQSFWLNNDYVLSQLKCVKK